MKIVLCLVVPGCPNWILVREDYLIAAELWKFLA